MKKPTTQMQLLPWSKKTTMTVKENEGLIKLPVKITGKRNGMIRLTIKAEGVDGSSATIQSQPRLLL